MTKDIDALYEPKSIINQLVSKIAFEDDLPEGWLNDSVKGFVTDAAPREDFLILPGLKIATVSADYLLAMKLMAARIGETDYNDVNFLVKKMEISTVAEMENIILTYYPPERILPKTKYFIEQTIDELNAQEQDLSL
jgi:hypothetical protein